MSMMTFRGGIHPPHAKSSTEHKATEVAVQPKMVTIPLRQHIGATCEAVVKKGDEVKLGQLIGEPVSFVAAPVHSSVSGKVVKVAKAPIAGGEEMCVFIENDMEDTLHESVQPLGDFKQFKPKEVIEHIKQAGIVGMGGAGFPLHIKLSPPEDKKIEFVILNGAECEPYLTADHRLMLEDPESVVHGIKIMMYAVGVEKGYIGIEDNKPDAIASMQKACADEDSVEVVKLRTKYPQGAEKQLIYACVKREVPSGALPMDVGVVVSNVATASSVSKRFTTGMPLVKRICTITGSAIADPKNLWIKVGTPLNEIIEQCGGYAEEPGKLILGGPMMGLAQHTDELPSTKTTSGILVFSKKEGELPDSEQCMKCGKCVDICPAFLQPLYISAHSIKYNFDKAQEFGALDCIECGSCSFICPSKRPLLHTIRVAKREIMAKRRRSK